MPIATAPSNRTRVGIAIGLAALAEDVAPGVLGLRRAPPRRTARSDRRAGGRADGAVTCGSSTPPPGRPFRMIDGSTPRNIATRAIASTPRPPMPPTRRPGPIPGPIPRRSSMFSLRRLICQRMAPILGLRRALRGIVAHPMRVGTDVRSQSSSRRACRAAAPHRRRRRPSAASGGGSSVQRGSGATIRTGSRSPRRASSRSRNRPRGEAAEQGGAEAGRVRQVDHLQRRGRRPRP